MPSGRSPPQASSRATVRDQYVSLAGAAFVPSCLMARARLGIPGKLCAHSWATAVPDVGPRRLRVFLGRRGA
jgi:hypothetical protein